MKQSQQIGGRVVETSSKTGENVEELFNAVTLAYAQSLPGGLPSPEDSFPLNTGKTGFIRSKCCHD